MPVTGLSTKKLPRVKKKKKKTYKKCKWGMILYINSIKNNYSLKISV